MASVYENLTIAGNRYGVNPDDLAVVAHLESRFNPSAKNKNSSAGGLFQFIDSTAKQYGLEDRYNVEQSSDAGARLMRDNAKTLSNRLGRKASVGELYLAHQQGAGGALNLLTSPNARAVDIVGHKAVKLNGGDENMTAQQFADLWINKANKISKNGTKASRARAANTDTKPQEEATSAPERDYSGVYKAYYNGSMKPEHQDYFKRDIANGKIPRPEIPEGVLRAYNDGSIKPEHKIKFDQYVADGIWALPEVADRQTQNGSTIPQASEYGAPTQSNLNRDFGDQILRQVGLTGRAVVEGGASLNGVFSNPITALINMMREDENQIPFAREAIGNLLTQAGVPEPETMLENIVQEVVGAMTGTGATIKLAEVGARGAVGVTRAITQNLAAAPTSQAASTLAGELAGQAAQAAGANPAVQVIANVVGGGAGGSIGGKTPTAKAPKQEILPPDIMAENVGKLVRSADVNKPKTLQKLAEIADIDAGAVKSADDLGIDLPADVFSNNEHLKQAAGLGRSDLNAPGSGIWAQTVKNAIGKADEVIANFSNKGGVAGMSDDIKASLDSTRNRLKAQSGAIYNKVDKAFPKDVAVEPDNIVKFLNGKVKELGGESGLNPAEKKLLAMVTDPDQKFTYGRLLREKGYIGKALARSESPYGSMSNTDLNGIYDAMRLDQMATVKRIGGDDLGQELAQANALYTKQKDLEDAIIKRFSKEGDGSLAGMLGRALNSSSKGDNAQLNKILRIIPKDLQREAVLTGIANLSKSAVASEVGFGFAQFANFYSNLRGNKPIYAQIKSIIGQDAHDMMENMYVVSKRITEARGNVQKTGKANQSQALAKSMSAENFMQRMISSTIGRKAVKLTATGIGGHTGGAVGAVGGNAIADVIIESGKGSNRINAANKVFSSDEFGRVAVELGALGKTSKNNIAALSKTEAFLNWAKKVSIKEPNRWLAGVVLSSENEEWETRTIKYWDKKTKSYKDAKYNIRK